MDQGKGPWSSGSHPQSTGPHSGFSATTARVTLGGMKSLLRLFTSDRVRSLSASGLFLALALKRAFEASEHRSAYLVAVAGREALVAVLFALRERAKAPANMLGTAIGLLSTFLPLALNDRGPRLYDSTGTESYCWGAMISGMALSTWSMIALGKSFGISPASRTRVVRGPYRVMKHPMYVSHFFTLLGFVLMVPTPHNVSVVLACATTYWIRAKLEEGMLLPPRNP